MVCLSLFLLDYKGYKRQLVPFTALGTMPGTKEGLEVDFLDFNLNDGFFTPSCLLRTGTGFISLCHI